MMARIPAGIVLLLALHAPSGDAQAHARRRSTIPKACFFFAPPYEPDPAESTATYKNYSASVGNLYRVWCATPGSTANEKRSAADAMVRTWKLHWDEDPPFDTVFHERGASDLLSLMAFTHEMPAQMAGDPAFVKMWVEECKSTCFTIWGVPKNAAQEHGVAMQLWLRNDLLDNLKRKPASEPVLEMLRDAQFRLVD